MFFVISRRFYLSKCCELKQHFLYVWHAIDQTIIMACHILYGRPYCNDAKEGVGGITPPKLNRGG